VPFADFFSARLKGIVLPKLVVAFDFAKESSRELRNTANFFSFEAQKPLKSAREDAKNG
jgi:hypothetical protein